MTSKSSLIQFLTLIVACIYSAGNAPCQGHGFALEQIMSSPFPEDLVAAPKGGRVAWVFNARGVRNIWIAELSGGSAKARALTTYTDDDGQALGEMNWSPDGGAIVYTRGGDMEMGREYPNPRSFPQGVEQAVWAVSVSGGAPRRLGEGHSPAVSPRGDIAAFIFKGQVWQAKLDGSDKAEQWIHARGDAESLRWSPDGAQLAFVSGRGDHSFIGVYDVSAKALNYLNPSVDSDSDPVWSPDGRRIAFIRIPASQERFIFGPKRSAQPWSIRIADAATGVGRQVWMAKEGQGSVFHHLDADAQLYWAAGDRLVFPWEESGWTHLYAVPTGGGAATLLTPGEFEVEHISVSPDRREILFSSNQDDVDRRHLWKVSVDSRPPSALTRGQGIEWSPAMVSDGRIVALLHSDARHPARPACLDASGELHDLAPDSIPDDFPAQELVEPQPVLLSAADGVRIHAQLFLPPNAKPGERHPAVVFFHGGSRRQMLLGWHYMAYYHNCYAMNQYLASRGYAVLSVNYRSGIGYGMEFREALNYGASGASEFNDVMGAGLYLRARPDVDPLRIGLWGGSYGGYLTALGLARASDLFAAGVDLHGVHDWNLEIQNFLPSYDPSVKLDAARLAWESSPLASVKTWRSPVLLIHGDDDRNVPFAETVHLVEALRKQGVEFQELIFPDEIHDFLTYRRWAEAYLATAQFFETKLNAHHPAASNDRSPQ